MRALKGGIPRAFPSHRTPEGAAYGAYARAKVRRLSLPADAMPTLKEAGRAAIELDRLHASIEGLRGKARPRRELRRLERQRRNLRRQFLDLERRLEELAAGNGHRPFPSPEELLEEIRRGPGGGA